MPNEPPNKVVPFPNSQDEEGEQRRREIIAWLRKNYPDLAHVSDEEIIQAAEGLI